MVSYWEKKDAYSWGHSIQSEFSTGSQTRQISTSTSKDYEVHAMRYRPVWTQAIQKSGGGSPPIMVGMICSRAVLWSPLIIHDQWSLVAHIGIDKIGFEVLPEYLYCWLVYAKGDKDWARWYTCLGREKTYKVPWTKSDNIWAPTLRIWAIISRWKCQWQHRIRLNLVGEWVASEGPRCRKTLAC